VLPADDVAFACNHSIGGVDEHEESLGDGERPSGKVLYVMHGVTSVVTKSTLIARSLFMYEVLRRARPVSCRRW